jgi:N4-gp56 family major capsid protein
MARTQILPTDPHARKAWAMRVATDSVKEAYWSRHIGAEGSRSMIVKKTDLESGPGDEVTTTLVAKLRGAPVTEGVKLAGKEMRLDFATHKMRVNVIRQGVNVGTKMDQKRVDVNLKAQGRARLTDYIKELYEEYIACAMAGSRGVSTNEFQHLEVGYAGYPNALRAPDSDHLYVGTAGDKVKATLVAGDKLALSTLNNLQVKAKKFLGGAQDGKSVRMEKIQRNGKECWVLVTMPEGMQDLRSDSGTQGWFEAQKALTQSIGRESDLFKGGAGWFNGVLVDECDVGVKFSDYGAGANVNAMRSIFAGANAGVIAHGTKGMENGLAIELDEDEDDRGFEKIITFMMIFGADRATYTPVNGANARDYGSIEVDHAYTLAPGSTI